MAHLKKTRLKIVGLKQNSTNSNRAIYDRLLVQRGANVLTSKALSILSLTLTPATKADEPEEKEMERKGEKGREEEQEIITCYRETGREFKQLYYL